MLTRTVLSLSERNPNPIKLFTGLNYLTKMSKQCIRVECRQIKTVGPFGEDHKNNKEERFIGLCEEYLELVKPYLFLCVQLKITS